MRAEELLECDFSVVKYYPKAVWFAKGSPWKASATFYYVHAWHDTNNHSFASKIRWPRYFQKLGNGALVWHTKGTSTCTIGTVRANVFSLEIFVSTNFPQTRDPTHECQSNVGFIKWS